MILRHLLDTVMMGAKGIQLGHQLDFGDILQKFFQVSHIFPHLKSHLMLAAVITRPNIKYVTKIHPRMIFRYLGDYLALSLSRASRLTVLRHHYNILTNYFNEDFMVRIVDGQIELWEEHKGQDRYVIALTFPDYYMEGDLSLVFNYNANRIFTMSFTIVPGKILNIPVEHVLFIARMQGVAGHFDLIRRATKRLNDISPGTMLLVAIEAVAAAMGISDIAGICVKEQIAVGRVSQEDTFRHVYDDFWQNHGGERINDVFHLPLPLPHKPLSAIKKNHRCRVNHKRQLKKEVMEQIYQAFVQKCLRESISSKHI